MNQTFNPYQRNVDILRGFFRKPIVLITAIFFGISIIYCFISPIITLITLLFQTDMLGNSNIRVNSSIELSSILFLISFLMLYCKSRSKKTYVKLNGAVTVARVASIIYTVLNAISLAVIIILGILFFVFSGELPDFIFNTFLILIICSFITYLSAFLLYLGMSRFTGGIKYSLSSVFITKRSAIFTAVTAFLYAASNIALSIIFYCSSSKISEAFDYFLLWIESNIEDNVQFPNLGDMTSFINTSLAFSIVRSIIDALPFILIGVLAIMYYNYIKKNTSNLVLAPNSNDATEFFDGRTPVQNYSAQPPVNPINQNGPSPYVPQSAYPNNRSNNYPQESTPIGNPEAFVYENPYTANAPQNTPPMPTQNFEFQPVFNNSGQPVNPANNNPVNNNPNELTCPGCGKTSPSNMSYCPYCGTILKD